MRCLHHALALLVASSLLVTGACKSKPGEKLRSGPLITRVDGEAGLHVVAAKVVAAIKADPAASSLLAPVDLTRFEERLASFLCHAAGGPCRYDGKLSDVWVGVTLDQDGFEALMELVITGMTDAELPQKEQNDLIDLMMKAHAAEG